MEVEEVVAAVVVGRQEDQLAVQSEGEPPGLWGRRQLWKLLLLLRQSPGGIDGEILVPSQANIISGEVAASPRATQARFQGFDVGTWLTAL